MEHVILSRFETSDHGTFGRCVVHGEPFFSGELPDRHNIANWSCINAGDYAVVWTWSPRFKRMMYLLRGTDPRVGIREHPANLMGDRAQGYLAQLNGCIALGHKLGWIDRQKALLVSAPAVRRFETLLERKPFRLSIVEAYSSG
jgi:hypothetical protein